MLFSENVTFIIPIFRLKSDRIQNLKFIIPPILNTECKILIVEQAKDELSDLSNIIPIHENIKHLLYTSNSEIFHKSGIINWAVKNHVDTKYAWVNDVDFYMKFDKVLSEDWNSDFIKPYISGKKLSADDTKKIIDGEKLNVSYEDESAEYISLYGALSFIFEKNAFLNIGGMDETIFGWGKEDVELSARIQNLKLDVQEMDFKGIHLWHPMKFEMKNLEQSNEERMDMAVVTCHFNWCNYTSPVRNLNNFLNRMELDNIPVYGIELSLTDQFSTKGRKNWKHIKVGIDSVCFQKEACINILEKTIPPQYTKIAWVDADLLFTNKNWYTDTSKKLDRYKIVQMYERGHSTDASGRIKTTKPGVVAAGGPASKVFGHPGGAWAARREFWKHGGLYSRSILGSGDSIFVFTIFGEPIINWENPNWKKLQEWKKSITSYVKKDDISFVSGDFVHDWHGDAGDRNYINRNVIIQSIDQDLNIKFDENGIIKIVNVGDDVYKNIFSYFLGRNEDGNKAEVSKSPTKILTIKYPTEIYLIANNETLDSNIVENIKNSVICHFNVANFRKFSSDENLNYLMINSYDSDGGGYFIPASDMRFDHYYFYCKQGQLYNNPWKKIREQFPNKECFSLNDIVEKYPYGTEASIGFIGAHYFQHLFNKIHLIGFTFQGWKGHNWDYENTTLSKLKNVIIHKA